MLDVCLLGTAGMMPLPHRWLTAALMRYNGSNLLIDCGEGTQIAIKEKAGHSNRLTLFALPITMQIISADFRGCFSQWEMRNGQNHSQ